MATLFQLTERASQIEEALYETGGEITPEIEALMTETAAELPAKVDNYNALIQKLGAMSDNCDKEIKRLQALKRTADNGAKSIKGHLLAAMQTFGFDRLEGNFCKVSRRKSRALSVDEATCWPGSRKSPNSRPPSRTTSPWRRRYPRRLSRTTKRNPASSPSGANTPTTKASKSGNLRQTRFLYFPVSLAELGASYNTGIK